MLPKNITKTTIKLVQFGINTIVIDLVEMTISIKSGAPKENIIQKRWQQSHKI